jgi:thioredoxin 1
LSDVFDLDFAVRPEGARSVGAIKTVTDTDFANVVLQSDKPVLVDFWAEWCGPCRMVHPVLEEFAAEQDNLQIVKLNVDENPEIATRYRITSIPALTVFQNGGVVKQIIGAKPKAALRRDLADYLG